MAGSKFIILIWVYFYFVAELQNVLIQVNLPGHSLPNVLEKQCNENWSKANNTPTQPRKSQVKTGTAAALVTIICDEAPVASKTMTSKNRVCPAEVNNMKVSAN